MGAQQATRRITKVVIVAIVAVVGILLVAQLAGVGDAMDISGVDAAVEFPEPGQTYELANTQWDQTTVSATEGRAIAFEGGDAQESFVAAPSAGNWSTGDWAMLVTATPAMSSNGTHTIAAYQNESIVVEWHNGSYRATLLGDTQNGSVSIADPGGQTPVGVSHDDSAGELAIRTPNDTATATLATTEPERDVSHAFNGTLEETRVLNETLSDSQYDTYAGDPIDPLNGTDHALRLMYDEGAGAQTRAFYAGDGATAELSGHRWTTGVRGPDLSAGADYELGDVPLTITIPESSYLVGAPIVHIDSVTLLGASFDSVVGGFGSAIQLVPIALFVIVAGAAVVILANLRQ